MLIAFRVDASIKIGSGHVMRCLTLAEKLRDKGNKIIFLSRSHVGNLNDLIQKKGFNLIKLNIQNKTIYQSDRKEYLEWLGCDQQTDVNECIKQIVAQEESIALLIIDHYALDELWEKRIRPFVKKIMIIDDLADRKHDCDILLDQTLGCQKIDYLDFVNEASLFLLGTNYALLRQEFDSWRSFSLKRREDPKLNRILITMGGVDAKNITYDVLKILHDSQLSQSITITVVVGESFPWMESIKGIAKQLQNKIEVLINVNNMAELMANSDFAIGAAGSTAWEGCCLGLPSILITLADNQKLSANILYEAGAAISVDTKNLFQIKSLIQGLSKEKMISMQKNAANLVDGKGINRTISKIQSQIS